MDVSGLEEEEEAAAEERRESSPFSFSERRKKTDKMEFAFNKYSDWGPSGQ